ncbi:MAG: hypothetical protein II821_01090 [Treponema sp.]|nr:hypothetical protein [Treponema sp.]
MITSFFPGRVRLRAPIFKEMDLVEKARSILSKSDAVKNIETNPVTGSVLIEYFPSKVPMEKLLPMQDFFARLANEAQRFDGSTESRQKISEMLSALEGIF